MKERGKGYPADASSLIYLAKGEAFEEAQRCISRILVPPGVWEEAVVAGERIGAPEVGRIKDAAGVGFVRRIRLARVESAFAGSLADAHRIGRGESEVLTVGRQSGICIVDEGRAARVAKELGIIPVPTLLLPVLGHRAGGMRRSEALALIRRLAVVTGARAEVVFAIEEELSGGSR